MEFKGTKGDWYKTYRNGSWLIQDYDCFIEDSKGCIAEVYWFNDGLDTAEANAKLISCAPEMLEMLIKCREYFLLKTDLKSEERAEAIGELIEKATTI